MPSGSDRIFEALDWSTRTAQADDRRQCAGRPADAGARRHPRRASRLLDDPAVDIATLAAEIVQGRRAHQSERGEGGRLAGSRRGGCARSISPAPPRPPAGPLYHHIGLYAYRRAALERFVALPPSPLEQREKLEQLRALEAGMRIDVAIVDSVPLGVDTPEDLEARALGCLRR